MWIAAEHGFAIDFAPGAVEICFSPYDQRWVGESYSDHPDKPQACCVAICKALIASKEPS
jgi:hypothetical protein